MKITVNVTNPELDAMEDFIVAWNLCDKHKKANHTEEEYFSFTRNCKNCIKINDSLRKKSLSLWSKLVTAYDNTKKK